ncbi:MAG: histidine kinase N-terminal 7TM domain-containing protein [Deferribacterales bacterium]
MFDLSAYSINILSLSLIFIIGLITSTSVAAFKRLDRPIYRLFSAYAVLTWIYSAAYLLQTMSLTLDNKIFWANVKVTSVCFAPAVWVWITCMMTNRRLPHKAFNIIMVLTAIANITVIWSDSYLHIFRSSVTMIKISDTFYMMNPNFGIWFTTIYIWSLYLPTIISIMMFAASFINTGRSGRIQYGMMIIGIMASLLGGVPLILKSTLIDTYPFAAGFTMVIYFVLIHKYHLFDVVPIAKNAVLDLIKSAVIIYDSSGKLSERTSYSKTLLPDDSDVANIQSLCKKLRFDLNDLEYGRPMDRMLEYPEFDKVFNVSLMIISDSGRNVDGYMAYATDITVHKKLDMIRHENEMLEHKNIITGDIHDSVSGNVTIIGMLASQEINSLSEAKAALDQIFEISVDTSKEIRFLMNAYEKNNPSIKDFVSDLRHLGNILTEGSGISFYISSDRIENYPEMPFKNYLNIVRFFKECVINSVKHSSATEISANISLSSAGINIIIADNGVGFDPESRRGRGIKSMYRRINSIGGTVNIKNADGTQISAVIPFEV